jgi:hypothetical protein
MYEKQVHKDGIRRAVMTSMGSATTRYFEKDGLRKLFLLGKEGECEFLSRMRERGLASMDDSPETRLTSHEGVVGVSSHDNLYSSKSLVNMTNDGETKENPFSSPVAAKLPVSGGNIPTESNETQDDSPKRVMGRSQRALFKNKAANESRKMQDEGKGGGKENFNAPLDSKVENDIKTIAHAESPSHLESVADILRRVDNLHESGDRVAALGLLMDLLEGKYQALPKDDKMKVHQRTAMVAYELQWL